MNIRLLTATIIKRIILRMPKHTLTSEALLHSGNSNPNHEIIRPSLPTPDSLYPPGTLIYLNFTFYDIISMYSYFLFLVLRMYLYYTHFPS